MSHMIHFQSLSSTIIKIHCYLALMSVDCNVVDFHNNTPKTIKQLLAANKVMHAIFNNKYIIYISVSEIKF